MYRREENDPINREPDVCMEKTIYLCDLEIQVVFCQVKKSTLNF